MSDIFTEVDEALKQEKLEALWAKYGGLLIGAIAAIILGTAANAGYTSWKTAEHTKQTNTFLSVTDNANPTSESILSVEQDIKGGLKTLLQTKAAAAAIEQGNPEEGLKLLNQISNDGNANAPLRALASYMNIHKSTDITDTQKREAFQKIAEDTENPWNAHAKLDTALLLGENENNFTEARKHLKTIIDDENLPQTLRQKAQSIDILYALKEHSSKTE